MSSDPSTEQTEQAQNTEQLLVDALQRAETAESGIARYEQRFTDKYGMCQSELLEQLNALRASLQDDEHQLLSNKEEIHRNNAIIHQSYHQLHELKQQLLSERQRCLSFLSSSPRHILIPPSPSQAPHKKDAANAADIDDDDDKQEQKECNYHHLPILDGEDFRLMMKKYFQELKLQCLSANNDLSTEELWDRVIAPNYKISTEQLRSIRNLFVRDMRFALNKNESKRKRSSLKMLGSSIYSLPNSNNYGVYYALDWGGTSFRVLRIELNGHIGFSTMNEMRPALKIPEHLKRSENHHQLFDLLAQTIKTYMIQNHFLDIKNTKVYHLDHEQNLIKIPLEEDEEDVDDDSDDDYRYNRRKRGGREREPRSKEDIDYRYPMGFTFSFPVQQKAINQGVLMEWTKGFDIGGVVGKDVVALMQEALDRYNIPLRIDVVCNDTVGTLLSCAFEKSACRVGLILGTGTNAAYIEPKKNNEIINIEWGAFDKGLPRQPTVDIVMDSYSLNPGSQFTEKMVSGEYLGEMVRLLSLDVFGEKIRRYGERSKLNKRWGLTAPVVSQILQRFDSQSMTEIHRILRIDLGLQEFTADDGKLFVQLCRVIVNRSADLTSALLLGVLEKTGLFTKIKDRELYVLNEKFTRKVVVGIDGSVWQKVPRYQQRMRNTMQKIVNKKVAEKIKLITSHDGSGKGAAFAVATHCDYVKQQQFAKAYKKYD